MVEYIRSGKIDVRSGKMDLHVNMVRRGARVDIQHGFVVRVVDIPADAIGGYGIGFGDLPLHMGCTNNR